MYEDFAKASDKEISENTVFGMSIKSLGAIIVGVSFFIGLYYRLTAEVELAKTLPPSEVSKADHLLLKQTVDDTKVKIDRMDKKLDKIQDKLFELK
tara:strand:- start:867 stop:1154 length:288 start_codon:yes stop_codon:yes gene_type:complete